MIVVNINKEQQIIITNELSKIIQKYVNIDYVECIFMSIYKDMFKTRTKHIDIYLIPSKEQHYEDLKAIINSPINFEEIYIKTNFLITEIVENPKDYKDIKTFDIIRLQKLNRLYNSEILFDRNDKYRNILKKYETSLDKCFNIIETNPKIMIKKYK